VIHSALFRVTTVIEQKFFGFEPTSIEGTTVRVSDLENHWSTVRTTPRFYGVRRELATAMRTSCAKFPKIDVMRSTEMLSKPM